ncbi:MAG: hypothetical protein R3A45_03450 [Bdellovibrionota bacterium]
MLSPQVGGISHQSDIPAGGYDGTHLTQPNLLPATGQNQADLLPDIDEDALSCQYTGTGPTFACESPLGTYAANEQTISFSYTAEAPWARSYSGSVAYELDCREALPFDFKFTVPMAAAAIKAMFTGGANVTDVLLIKDVVVNKPENETEAREGMYLTVHNTGLFNDSQAAVLAGPVLLPHLV